MGIFFRYWDEAHRKNNQNILNLLEFNPEATLIDLGCYRGWFTKKLGNKVGSQKLFGCDIDPEAVKEAKESGIEATVVDLNRKLPYTDDIFDVVHSNQVIEHLNNVDNFVDELWRITKPGGYIICSTENLASWHNIFALLLGQQPFSETISHRYNIGNKFSPHYRTTQGQESWSHRTIFTTFALKEIFEVYGFKNEKIIGAGYHPFLGATEKIFSRINTNHSHFITLKSRKANNGQRKNLITKKGPNLW